MSLDDFVNNMQAEIDAETLAAYGSEAFARWKNPLYMGPMPDADACGRVTGTCGDTIQVFLRVVDGRVAAASFTTDGCGPSAICGSFAAELSLGRKIEDLVDFAGEAILGRTGGLPEDDRHCAFLSAAAVRAAVDDYMGRQVKKP
ncbi:MAG: iron-sulfur cluster assembly scaffold protein [Desulfobacteraceae bacterium]|jgi:nitrogen fixation NifU-like protein|nr:iron-sulfur cluster assembly scaffold protein [Desulfobacteraceae bacterium]